MTGVLELVIIIFLAGLLAVLYGEKVHNELVSNAMGLLTLSAVLVLAIIAFVVAVT